MYRIIIVVNTNTRENTPRFLCNRFFCLRGMYPLSSCNKSGLSMLNTYLHLYLFLVLRFNLSHKYLSSLIPYI